VGAAAPVPVAPLSETRPVARAFTTAPRLRLFADDVVIHRTEGLGSVYDTERAPLLALQAVDPAEEAAARRLLESFGAVPLDCLDDWAPSVDADYAVRCEGTVHDFCAFGAYVVPQLRALGWIVEIDADYPFRVVEREPGWYAQVEPDEDRPDWFGLELGIEIDGKRVNLLPALVALLERSNGHGGLGALAQSAKRCLALPVGDGLYVPVPADRARAILRVVAELYDGTTKRLELPRLKTPALLALEEAFAIDDHPLVVRGDPGARAWAASLSEPLVADRPTGLRAELRPYQLEGLAWLQRLRASGAGGILADDMGLGKTLQTIAHLLVEKHAGRLDRPALIVAPTSLVSIWEREIARFAPELDVVVYHGGDRHDLDDATLARANVIVTSYPILVRDEDRFAAHAFHLVALDEAQTIKNLRSRAHAAARSVRADHRLCLSGTPVENHLGELWALLDFVCPGLLGDELHFGRFWRGPIEKEKNEERLLALRELVSPYILRRNKRDVAKELPPKTEVQRPVELRGPQRELYESIRVAAHAEVRRLIKKKGLAASTVPILGALTKLRQVCCDPRLVRIDAASRVRESAKYTMFFELLEKQLEGDHKVLVFSQFTSMLALLSRGLDERRVKYSLLTGDTVDRAAAVDRFENGDARVFLISLRAGGTGLTLTSADVVVHYDPWWNPAVQAQATDRAYRIGQTKPVISYHLFAAGSVEERILALQKSKRHVADAILGEADAARASSALSEPEVDVLFAPLGA
jgi:superfamily II DNA or RNA helicase